MGLVKDWRRQAARAMGVSLIAPAALLLGAVVVAAGGGGLGGLGSLGQISSGPTLPASGPAPNPRASLDEAELATAGLTAATSAAPGATGASPSAEPVTPAAADRTGGGGAGAGPQAPGGRPGDAIVPVPGPRDQQTPVTGRTPAAPVAPTTPPQSPGAPPADPVADVIDTARGLGESLPGPAGPTTGDILDSLLGPRR